MRTPKTKEVKVIQSKGDGVHWDDEAEYERSEYSQIRHDLAEYRVAYGHMGVPCRVITRRVPVDQ